jgi:hypothetical protein
MLTDKNDEDLDLSCLFICEEYVEKVFVFGDIIQKLLCSRMSCTDYDLTGQIVWPAAIMLCWFLKQNSSMFCGKNIIELGAGCGLSGFFVSKFAKTVVVTDGNDIVVRLLQKNQNHIIGETSNPTTTVIKKLIWGLKSEIKDIYTFPETFPDYIIGADIILWPSLVIPLIETLRWLLSFKASSSVAYISYVIRAHSTTSLFISTAEKYGLNAEIQSMDSFLPQPEPTELKNLEKILFKINIMKSQGVSFNSEPDVFNTTPESIELQSSAC